MQKNDGGSQLLTCRAICSVKRQAKHRDVLLGQSSEFLGLPTRFTAPESMARRHPPANCCFFSPFIHPDRSGAAAEANRRG
jgi:hypothetical protein